MLNCIYHGKRLSAINIIEECDYGFRKEIKLAGSNKQLVCEDCNSPMVLRICQNKMSHFAHWKGYGEACPYKGYSSAETEQHKRCKRLLYNYFRKLYPDAMVELEFKVLTNRRSDVFIKFSNGNRLIIDIQKSNLSTSSWNNKHIDYKNAGITDIWIINGNPYGDKERNMPFFQQIMLNEAMDGIAIFLNVEKETVLLLKKIVNILHIKISIRKSFGALIVVM